MSSTSLRNGNMGRRGRKRDNADDFDDSLEEKYYQRQRRREDECIRFNTEADIKVLKNERDDGAKGTSDMTAAEVMKGMQSGCMNDLNESKTMMSTDELQRRCLKKKRQQERRKRKRERREELKKGELSNRNEHIHDNNCEENGTEKQENQQKIVDKEMESKKRLRDEDVLTKTITNKKQGSSYSPPDPLPPQQPRKKKLKPRTPNQTQIVSCKKGVMYQDIIIGKGPVIQDRKKVRVSYVLRAASSGMAKSNQLKSIPGYGHGKVLDSSSSFGFRLGRGEVINGWDIGLKGMRQGGRRYLIVPPQAGYGSKDIGGGAGAALFFDISVLS